MIGKENRVTFCGKDFDQLRGAIMWLKVLKEDVILGDDEVEAVDTGIDAITAIMEAMDRRGKIRFEKKRGGKGGRRGG